MTTPVPASVTPVPAPTAIDYSSRDYASIRASVLGYAQVLMPEWSAAYTGDPNDFGVMIIELLAYMGDILSYYTDRVANESFLPTATQRSSVLALASLLNYTVRSAQPASVPMTITIDAPTTVTLPAHFQITTTPDGTNDSLIYETLSSVTINPGDPPVTVTAVEGTTVPDEIVATSCGDLNEAYVLAQTPVVASSVTVSVVENPIFGAQVWTVVDTLLTAAPNDNSYEIAIDENDAVTIIFGDNVNGRVPPRGAVIHATYRVGGGSDGNVAVGTITSVVDPTNVLITQPTDGTTVSASQVSITVFNAVAATGGTDPESLDSIKTNAPLAVRSGGRAVSLNDYAALALSVPSVEVGKANAVSTVYTNVTIFLAPPGGGQPDNVMLNEVVNYVQPRAMVNVTIVAATPVYVPIDITATVSADPRFNQSDVNQAVLNALNTLLGFDNVDFGNRIPVSSVYNTIGMVQGVDTNVLVTVARSGLTTLTDVVLRENEIAVPGNFTINITGGVVNSDVSNDIIGAANSSATPAGVSGAPVITLLRCDSNSTHVEMNWQPGSNTTSWYVQIDYLNNVGSIVDTVIVGPYTVPTAVMDLSLIGTGRAASVSFRTRAYNSSLGPVISPATINPYLCEGTFVLVPVTQEETYTAPVGLVFSSVTDNGLDSYGQDTFSATMNWVQGAEPPQHYLYRLSYLDPTGALLYPEDQGPSGLILGSLTTMSYAGSAPAGAQTMQFRLIALNDDGSEGASTVYISTIVPRIAPSPTGVTTGSPSTYVPAPPAYTAPRNVAISAYSKASGGYSCITHNRSGIDTGPYYSATDITSSPMVGIQRVTYNTCTPNPPTISYTVTWGITSAPPPTYMGSRQFFDGSGNQIGQTQTVPISPASSVASTSITGDTAPTGAVTMHFFLYVVNSDGTVGDTSNIATLTL